MSSTLPVLTSLCPICYVSPPKYRCPRCSMRTCSLECSQAHKIRASCSGVRDPAKYIAKRDMKSSTIDMDFNFLKKVQKSREEGHAEFRKSKPGEAKTSRRKLEQAKRKSGMKHAKTRGVDVLQLPRWMERSTLNKTRWDAKNRCVQWTVEWIITTAEETKKVMQHRLADTTFLGDAFKEHSTGLEKDVHFLLRKAVQPANGSIYFRLESGKSLLENLRGIRIMEFPTVYAVDEIPETWNVEEPLRGQIPVDVETQNYNNTPEQ